MNPSKCSKCNRPIFWKEINGKNVPFDAKRRGDEFIASDSKHFDTCPMRPRICPACILEERNDLSQIHKINLDKPICQRHIKRGYFEIEKWGTAKRYPVENLYQLHKSLLRAEKRELRREEKLKEDGLDKHPMDSWVYSDV